MNYKKLMQIAAIVVGLALGVAGVGTNLLLYRMLDNRWTQDEQKLDRVLQIAEEFAKGGSH